MKGITGNVSDAYQRFAVKPLTAAAQQPVAAPNQTARAASPEAAKVSISSQARDLAAGGVNTQKVEALKASIADGSFKVNSQVVAQRILDGFGA
jgi:flagellar biosynthesis anti-sigma factor FlgM